MTTFPKRWSKPGTLNYCSVSTGAPNHLAAELFKRMAGVNIPRVPYKGTGPALVALIAGEVQLALPAQLTNTVQTEINVLGKMIKEVGIRLE